MHDPPIPEGIFGPYLGPLYVCKSPNDMNGLFVLDTDRVTGEPWLGRRSNQDFKKQLRSLM